MSEEKNTRLSIRKSRTFTGDERGTLETVEYGIEQDIPNQSSPLTGLRNLEALIDDLLAENTEPAKQDKYRSLPWRQSSKKQQLSTIAVTPEMPELAKELYNELKNSEKHLLRIGDTTYKLSFYQDAGTEFLQRWCRN